MFLLTTCGDALPQLWKVSSSQTIVLLHFSSPSRVGSIPCSHWMQWGCVGVMVLISPGRDMSPRSRLCMRQLRDITTFQWPWRSVPSLFPFNSFLWFVWIYLLHLGLRTLQKGWINFCGLKSSFAMAPLCCTSWFPLRSSELLNMSRLWFLEQWVHSVTGLLPMSRVRDFTPARSCSWQQV